MGSNHPKDTRRQVKGGIQIQLNKLSFMSNEVISGVLHIILEEPFQGHFLQINLQGFEDVHYSYSTGTGDSQSTVYAKALNSFLNYTLPVYDFSQGTGNQAFILQPSQFSIPFQIVIAEQLPSSASYFLNDHYKCNLKYQLTAQILSSEPNVRPLSGSQEIFIGQKIQIYDLPNITNSKQNPVICCCYKSGEISYNMQVNSRFFSPGEIIKIKINADLGKFKAGVKCLNIKLLGRLEMNAGINYQRETVNQLEKSIQIKVDAKQISQEVQIQIPDNVILSSQGQLIQMNYFLQIIPDVNTCCCVTNKAPHEMLIYINPNSDYLLSNKCIPQKQNNQNYQAAQNLNSVQLKQSQFNPIQQNQIQQMHLANLAYEQKLYEYYIQIDSSQRKVDFYQEMSKAQPKQIIYSQNLAEANNNQQSLQPIQNPNYYHNQENLIGQPMMKDQNKAYI